MEKELEYIVLENNIEYAVVEKIKKSDYYYMYLFNSKNVKDFCIRKLKNNKLYGLSNNEEFDEAILMLRKKNIDLINKLGM